MTDKQYEIIGKALGFNVNGSLTLPDVFDKNLLQVPEDTEYDTILPLVHSGLITEAPYYPYPPVPEKYIVTPKGIKAFRRKHSTIPRDVPVELKPASADLSLTINELKVKYPKDLIIAHADLFHDRLDYSHFDSDHKRKAGFTISPLSVGNIRMVVSYLRKIHQL